MGGVRYDYDTFYCPTSPNAQRIYFGLKRINILLEIYPLSSLVEEEQGRLPVQIQKPNLIKLLTSRYTQRFSSLCEGSLDLPVKVYDERFHRKEFNSHLKVSGTLNVIYTVHISRTEAYFLKDPGYIIKIQSHLYRPDLEIESYKDVTSKLARAFIFIEGEADQEGKLDKFLKSAF